ncbi:MAG: hypothetical protein GXN99_00800 [Candidatus Nanohaloarchaeota archaeon]|nr:hypothetical protein [Candidatus Nanohaloarchaeota archaeon]
MLVLQNSEKIKKKIKPIHYYVGAYGIVYLLISIYFKAFYALFVSVLMFVFLIFFKKKKVSHYLGFVIISSSFLFLSVRNLEDYVYFVSFVYLHLLLMFSLKKYFFTTTDVSLLDFYKKLNFFFRWFLRCYVAVMYFVLIMINISYSWMMLLMALPYLIFLLIHTTPSIFFYILKSKTFTKKRR